MPRSRTQKAPNAEPESPSDVPPPLIKKTKGVCGGRACVAGTRVPVWGLALARRMGLSEAQILRRYPSVSRKHLRAAWEYVAEHEGEIESDILDNADW